ncbi:SMP-30/gluconolactonase/LRE family protein [Sphingobacterium griseoflavum]|uniref:Gluconolactonase n=1 Tax=Sphingobacterium griseoflavum TaxID=1474952 RepID=A0ABQ3HSE4_9SPHI|nr:SMP-30/gluconolactonase/LRE family protein [Sphingobacterium griseoflavum]GHE30355.1 gluconolactonase [Sphingobacterium griseoflavum]
MKHVFFIMLILISLFAKAQKTGELVEISNQFSFTEGPTPDADGNIYFTDQPNNSIWRYGVDGRLTLFMQPAGRSNGLYFDSKGQIIACADEQNKLWRIDTETKHVENLVHGFEGKLLNGPNDIWISPAGAMYFTDPFYERDYWNRSGSELAEALYCLRNGQLTQVDADFVKPNGIVGSADGKLLFVADIGADRTYVYDIDEQGNVVNKRVFCEKGSDGMTLDRAGNLYLTGKGVFVYNAYGEFIRHIPVPAGWTANVCFGGAAHEYLFITASEKIFKIYPNW